MDSRPFGPSVHGTSRQEHWSGFPCPPPEEPPDPGIEHVSLHLLHCRQILHLEPPGKPRGLWHTYLLSHNSDFERSMPWLGSCWGYHKANIKVLTRLDSLLETHWTCESSQRLDRPFLTLVSRISKYLPPLPCRSFGSPVLRTPFPLLPVSWCWAACLNISQWRPLGSLLPGELEPLPQGPSQHPAWLPLLSPRSMRWWVTPGLSSGCSCSFLSISWADSHEWRCLLPSISTPTWHLLAFLLSDRMTTENLKLICWAAWQTSQNPVNTTDHDSLKRLPEPTCPRKRVF